MSKQSAPTIAGDSPSLASTENGTQVRLLVVEATGQDLGARVTRALNDLNGLLLHLAGLTERLLPCRLDDLRPSPFYNIEVGTKETPVDKAVVLIRSTQKSTGRNIANAYRVITENILDPFLANGSNQNAVLRAVGLCTFESAEDFKMTPPRNSATGYYCLAIVAKVMPATCSHSLVSKPCYDVFVERLQPIEESDREMVQKLMAALIKVATNATWGEENLRTPWTQRKCKRLSNWPNDESIKSADASASADH